MPCRGELSISHVQVGSEIRWSYEATVTEPQDGIVGAQGREVVLETERWEKMSENAEEGARGKNVHVGKMSFVQKDCRPSPSCCLHPSVLPSFLEITVCPLLMT